MQNKKIGFIGAGKMGGAIIKGLISSGFVAKENIFASESTPEAAQEAAERLGIEVITDNSKLITESDVVVLATKPYVIKKLLETLKHSFKENKLVISIAAGISTSSIEEILDNDVPVIRVMPNTPALVEEGMTAICRGRCANDDHAGLTKELFSKVGRSCEVPEHLIDAVTGVSGSGPAFFYLIIEALADGGVKLGIPKATALELAAQTALGAAKMILETGKHPSVLKDEVTTPGGCTAAGLATLEENAIRSAMIKTVADTAKSASCLG